LPATAAAAHRRPPARPPAAACRRDPARVARDELIQLLAAPSAGTASAARAEELVAAMEASRRPFREAQLGGGEWVVVYMKGAQAWTAWTAASRRNRASQALDPATRAVVNSGEVLGAALTVTASGTYSPRGAPRETPRETPWTKSPELKFTPVEVDVQIAGGALRAFGRELPLPIRGAGVFTIAYLDDDVRVFRSGKAVSVQVRAAALPRLLGGAAGV
jgi:hypothetical protein